MVTNCAWLLNTKKGLRLMFLAILLLCMLLLRWSLMSIADDIGDGRKHRRGKESLNHRNGDWWLKDKPNNDQEFLRRKAEIKCRNNTKLRIPNIIHHVWFGKRELLFHQYLSIRSAALIQKPDEVQFYIDESEPLGPLWSLYKSEVPCLTIVKVQPPTTIFGKEIKVVEHQSDVARLQILLKNGGIYLDNDVMVVRPFDPLLSKACVLGLELKNAFGNSIILGEPRSEFLQKWYDGYRDFDDSKWMEQSAYMPYRLHEEYSEIALHVEEKSFLRPSYVDGMEWMEEKNYDISKNYCVHLFARHMKKSTLSKREEELDNLNATYGSLARISLYGMPDLIRP